MNYALDWVYRFSFKEARPSGRPITDKMDAIFEKVEQYQHISSYDIAEELGIEHKTVLAHLKKTGVSMDKPLSNDDIAAMEAQLRNSVEEDRKHWRVNDVKCDAIYTAKSYEEFADRVAAAHLQPLQKKDFKNNRNGWNQFAAKVKTPDE